MKKPRCGTFWLVWLVGSLPVLGTWATAAEPRVWDFAAPDAAWRPRADSVTVKIVNQGGPAGRGNCLHIAGRMETNHNYATAPQVPVVADRLYRLSAWMRVDRVGQTTPMPYLKCEFPGPDRKVLGQVRTEACDPAKPGQWQQIAGEFRAPPEAQTCWLAVEKGTSGPTEIDLRLADVRLEPIARFTAADKYRLAPLPATLEKLRGVHPRLYLDQQRLTALRTAVNTTHADIWKRVRGEADVAAKRGPPAYILRDKSSGDEQLWQRGVGNTLPLLAMAYAVSGERKYLASAQAWALASCGYPTWGLNRYDGKDLAAGHQLFGLALVYDWCYHDLDPAARDTIRQTLVQRTAALFEAAAAGKTGWHRSYLQNHLWISITGMAAVGLALFDEEEDAPNWIGLPLDKYRRTMAALGSDGASHEGVGYWEYGIEYMLKFMALGHGLLEVDLYDGPWWRSTALYGQYLSLPRNAWRPGNVIVDIADCPRGHWYGPDHTLRHLAAKFHDGRAQWLAHEIDAAQVQASGASWLNLVWYDPGVKPQPPNTLPTLHHFADLGLVAARSNWSGDESLVVFKCGPHLGHEALEKFTYDPGGGHVHPDANHFVVFGQGEWLIRDDGYRQKFTGQHNTLLVNGRGQLGEGAQWFRGAELIAARARPRILQATSRPDVDEMLGDATAIYPAELGLERFQRRLLFIKPNVLLVVDDLATQQPADLELRFFPESATQRQGPAFVAQGKRAVLRIEPLTTQGVKLAAEPVSAAGRHEGMPGSLFAVRLQTKNSHWRNAVALSWAAAGEKPPQVTLRTAGDQWYFSLGKRQWSVDFAATGQPSAKSADQLPKDQK